MVEVLELNQPSSLGQFRVAYYLFIIILLLFLNHFSSQIDRDRIETLNSVSRPSAQDELKLGSAEPQQKPKPKPRLLSYKIINTYNIFVRTFHSLQISSRIHVGRSALKKNCQRKS